MAFLGFLHIPNIPRLFRTFQYCACLLRIGPGRSGKSNFPHSSTLFHSRPCLLWVGPGRSRMSPHSKHPQTFLDIPVFFLPASVYPCCPKDPTLFRIVPVVPGPSAMPNYPRLSQAFPDCFALLEVFRAVPGCPGITCASMGCTRLPTVIPGNASTSPCSKLFHIPPCPDGLFRTGLRWPALASIFHSIHS